MDTPHDRNRGEGLPAERLGDGECVVCGDDADGVDARTRQPICRRCASIRCDGGDMSPGRRRITSSVNFGGASNNYVSTPGDDTNHLSGEVSIEVSGASSDYSHPARVNATQEVIEDYDDERTSRERMEQRREKLGDLE